MHRFVADAAVRWNLSDRERSILAAVNPASPEDLLSLLWNFPGLVSRSGLDAPRLSNLAAGEAPEFLAVMADAELVPEAPPSFATGARHVPGTPWEPGSKVELPAPSEILAEPAPPPAEGAIDKRPAGTPWPVRDQGSRGTCVAFSVTALREHLEHEVHGVLPDLSEQFLFWATKTQTSDSRPTSDGTWITFCKDALDTVGVAGEALWPYSGAVRAGNVTQQGPGAPSAAATADALLHAHAAVKYHRGPVGWGNAAAVLQALASCRPVALSLPVFRDAVMPQGNNWNTPVGVLYGRVLDPPPTSIVVGGHAICVTGFQPDAGEPAGGYFVIRNSWGTRWGSGLPATGSYGPVAGYGQVSATYVDRFLWEMCRL